MCILNLHEMSFETTALFGHILVLSSCRGQVNLPVALYGCLSDVIHTTHKTSLCKKASQLITSGKRYLLNGSGFQPSQLDFGPKFLCECITLKCSIITPDLLGSGGNHLIYP